MFMKMQIIIFWYLNLSMEKTFMIILNREASDSQRVEQEKLCFNLHMPFNIFRNLEYFTETSNWRTL